MLRIIFGLWLGFHFVNLPQGAIENVSLALNKFSMEEPIEIQSAATEASTLVFSEPSPNKVFVEANDKRQVQHLVAQLTGLNLSD